MIRKTLFVVSFGAVSPRSKKQQAALKTLYAVQGADAAEVSRAGSRRQALGFTGRPRSPAAQARVNAGYARRARTRAGRRERRDSGT